ncbi:unnamed protein product, partial [Prorocentrum cordatum]
LMRSPFGLEAEPGGGASPSHSVKEPCLPRPATTVSSMRALLAAAALQQCSALSGLFRMMHDLLQDLGPAVSVQVLTPWGEELVGTATDSHAPCEDASEGSNCFNAVMWLKMGGFSKFPHWYPGYTAESPFQDVQAMLNRTGKSHCPKPCATASFASTPLQATDSVPALHKLPRYHTPVEGDNCHDAVEGDHCFRAIKWFMKKGIAAHPDWYPNLSASSTSQEVQHELHRQQKAQCPRPCTLSPRFGQDE